MIGDELHTFERFGLPLPLGDLGVELCEIGVTVAGKLCLILGGKGHQRVVDVPDCGLRQHRVKHVMRVAIRMNISCGVFG